MKKRLFCKAFFLIGQEDRRQILVASGEWLVASESLQPTAYSRQHSVANATRSESNYIILKNCNLSREEGLNLSKKTERDFIEYI